MTQLRELIAKATELAGAKDAFAEQAADALLGIFKGEIENPESVHRQRKGQSIEDRIFLFRAILIGTPGVDPEKAGYIIGLVTLYAHSCAVAKGREDLGSKRDTLAGKLSIEEPKNLAVAEVMTVADAATARVWD